MSYSLCKRLLVTAIVSKGFCRAATRSSARVSLRRYCNARANNPGSGWLVDPDIDFHELTENFAAISPRLNRYAVSTTAENVLMLLKSSLKEYETVSSAVDQLERSRAKNTVDFRNAAAGQDQLMQSEYLEAGKRIKREVKVANAKKKELYQTMLNAALKLPNRLHPSTPTSPAFEAGPSIGVAAPSACEGGDFRTQFSFGRHADLELRLLNEGCLHFDRLGFQLVTPPDFLRSDVLSAAGIGAVAESFFTLLSKDELHKLKSEISEAPPYDDRAPKNEDHDTYSLVGPSALGLSTFLMRTIVPKCTTPLKLVCCGRQHLINRDSEGAGAAFRKSSRVSVLVGTASSEELDGLYSELQGAVLQFLSSFGLPLQAKRLAGDELDSHEAARWVVTATGKDKCHTVASLSYHYDYISRRLMTEVMDAAVADHTYLHTISGYAADASELISVLEEHGRC